MQGLGDCSAFHSSRNLLGASQKGKFIRKNDRRELVCTIFTSRLEADSGDLEINEITKLLTFGITNRAVASDHMATVIR